MSDRTVPSLAQRLTALWDYLGIGTAHVSAPMPGDVAGLVAAAPDRVAGLVLCVPSRLDPAAFAGIPRRVLMIAGDGDMTDAVTARALPRLPGAQRQVLAGYAAPGWADVIADRTDAVVGRLTGFLDHFSADPPRAVAPEGTVAGISYRIHGAGPALVLLPFFLAPSQWEPAIPLLARRFSVVTLGGRHVGGIAALEDRARAPSYRAMVRTLVTQMAPQPGETMLDIGSGSGALDRMVARLWPGCPLTAVDVNPFLQREAKALAAEEGLGAIAFLPGSAEALPFPDASFDCVFSVTVLEECDADKALREAWRVPASGWTAGRGRAGDRPAAMVEPGFAAGLSRACRDSAAVGRAAWRGGCKPLPAHARGGVCQPRVLPIAGDTGSTGRPDLALSRRSPAVFVDGGGDADVARSDGSRAAGSGVDDGSPDALCCRDQTSLRRWDGHKWAGSVMS